MATPAGRHAPALGQRRGSRHGTLSHTGKEKAMKRSRFQRLGVGFAVLGLLVLGGARPGSAVTVSDGCGDVVGNGAQDIASLTATFDAATETILVDLVLCAAPDAATKYRVHVDHTAPFFDDDRNGDGVVDASDVCATTSDSGMMRKGTKNTGPGTITIDGSTIHYAVSLAALKPGPDGGRHGVHLGRHAGQGDCRPGAEHGRQRRVCRPGAGHGGAHPVPGATDL